MWMIAERSLSSSASRRSRMSRLRRFDKELVTPNLTAFTNPMLSVNNCATGSCLRHASRAGPRGGQIAIVTSPRISRRLASKSSEDTAVTASKSKDACVTLLTPQLCHDNIPAYTSACGGDVAPCFGAARHTHTHAWSLVLSGSSANRSCIHNCNELEWCVARQAW